MLPEVFRESVARGLVVRNQDLEGVEQAVVTFRGGAEEGLPQVVEAFG